MGTIELSNGIGNRRIPAEGLTGTIRIEVDDPTEPRVVVPEGVRVVRGGDRTDEVVEAPRHRTRAVAR